MNKINFCSVLCLILTISRPKFINVSPPGTTLFRALKPPSIASLQGKQTNSQIKQTGRKLLFGKDIPNTEKKKREV